MSDLALNIFRNNAFAMVSMTSAVKRMPTLPSFVTGLNLFAEKNIRTTAAAIEILQGRLALIKTTERGAPIEERKGEKAKIYWQETVRLAKGQTITAAEVQNVRAFGTNELLDVMQLVMDSLSGPTGLVNQMALTKEHMMLGAVQGIVLDADGSELVNWFDVLGEAPPAEINFDLGNATPASGAIRKKCNELTRSVRRTLGGLWLPGSSSLLALCGDTFYDDLTNAKEVRETYLNTVQAADLRNGNAFESFRYGGVTWVNYQGTDDNSTVSVHVDKAKFVPVGVPGLFEVAYAPSESIPFSNKPGQSLYSMIVVDDERAMWVRPEVYSYPLYICTVPAALYSGRRA